MTQRDLERLADRDGIIRTNASGLVWHQLRECVRRGWLVQIAYMTFCLPD